MIRDDAAPERIGYLIARLERAEAMLLEALNTGVLSRGGELSVEDLILHARAVRQEAARVMKRREVA